MPSFTITNKKKQKFVVLYDEDDTELLAQYTWHITKRGYAATNDRKLDGSRCVVLMHRRIMEAPQEKDIDHINGNEIDNRKENLRLCTAAENARNEKISRDNTSGFKGVCWRKREKKFVAQIRFNRKRKYLGYFDSALKAAFAYNVAAKELFGEFARINVLHTSTEE